MKKVKILGIIIGMLVLLSSVKSQTNWKWEKSDSVDKAKSQLYTDIKLIIAETWKSSKSVIQNDDKDGGVILIKGISKQTITWVMTGFVYYYNYNVKFLFKDNRYKIIIDNVYCDQTMYSTGQNGEPAKIEPFESGNYIKTSSWSGGLSEKKANELMDMLKTDLNNIFNDINISIVKKSAVSEW